MSATVSDREPAALDSAICYGRQAVGLGKVDSVVKHLIVSAMVSDREPAALVSAAGTADKLLDSEKLTLQ